MAKDCRVASDPAWDRAAELKSLFKPRFPAQVHREKPDYYNLTLSGLTSLEIRAIAEFLSKRAE